MRGVLLACLPVVVGGASWMLVNDPPSSGAGDRPARQVAAVVAHDSSGNGHHAIIQGPVQLGRPGRHGSSFSFDKAGSWLMVPPTPNLNPGGHDFLVSAWIYLRSSPGPGESYDVVRKGLSYTDPGEFKLEVLQHGWVRCTAKDDESHVAKVTTTKVDILDGRWHLIGCARTGRLWSVLADDTITSSVTELGVVENEVALSIGSKYGMGDRPDGRLDEVRLVLGSEYYPDAGNSLSRLEALEHGAPTARWRLDES